MSQGIWEQRLRELSWWNVDVRLTHNQRISTALDALSRELANAIPDDLKGDVRVAADNAMNEVRNKAIALATRLNTVDSTVTNANETRRDLAQRGISELDNYPSELSPWQEALVRGAVAGSMLHFGPLSWIAGEGVTWSINNYLANAREAEAQRQVRKISDAMDRYTFDGVAPGGPSTTDQNDREDRGGGPGPSSYDMIPGSDYNPINNVTNPQGPNVGDPQNPNIPDLPFYGPFIGPNPNDPDFDPDNPVSWNPQPWNPELPDCPPPPNWNDDNGGGGGDGYNPDFGNSGDPNFNWPIGTADPPYVGWTPDDPTGNGSNTWPRPGGIGGPGVPGGPGGFGGGGGGGGYAGGTGGTGGGSALVGGAGGGVALGGAKLMAGARTGAGLAGGGMMGGGMMGGGAAGGAGRGGAGGARGLSAGAASGAGRGGAGAAGGAAGRGGMGVAGGAAGQGSASKGAGTRGGAGRTGAGMAGGAAQNRDSDKKKRGVGMGAGIVAPSLDADEEIGARSQAAEAGGRAASHDFDA
ncbi:hypothetical protein ACQUSY_01660 [Microbacterium sp. YY-03]|uniref:hypothetical protein n=1 Tax=Microbacterium sp. YY-03 TaxID=3421636 RepID=UPI003D167CC8